MFGRQLLAELRLSLTSEIDSKQSSMECRRARANVSLEQRSNDSLKLSQTLIVCPRLYLYVPDFICTEPMAKRWRGPGPGTGSWMHLRELRREVAETPRLWNADFAQTAVRQAAE
jgi:hypothetical protein